MHPISVNHVNDSEVGGIIHLFFQISDMRPQHAKKIAQGHPAININDGI